MSKPLRRCAPLVSAALLLASCQRQPAVRLEYGMGERVPVGQMTYSVVESAWRTQLGDALRVRVPEQRFLLITLSVTNGTGHDVSIPLLTLEGPNGQTFRELENGESVENWFGLLRTISPAQTQQGRIVFDVPLTSYKLRVPDVSDSGFDKYTLVQVPLRLDTELPIQSPITPGTLK